jgi:FkbM family methyltransferase
MTFVTYAQNFEDVMLHRALKHVQRGFFVDVGAQHPTDDSVTKSFSLMGWRGINIEPVRHWFEMLEADRPYDTNLNIAVGEAGSDQLTLFEVEGTGLSTTDSRLAARYREEGRVVAEHNVPTQTLDEIFVANDVREVHFLKVDCEGAERTALASCSFDAIRPWIVVVEATEPNSQVSVHEEWEFLLTGRGYIRAYGDGLNLYYVASEHPELMPAFAAPPNVFDDFIRARDQASHDALSELHYRARDMVTELGDLRANVGSLSRSLDATTVQWEELRSTNTMLTAQRNDFEARLAVADEALRLATIEEGELHRVIADLRGQRWPRDGSIHQVSAVEMDGVLRRQHELIQQVSFLHTELARRDALIHGFLHSTSWRLTAPVRGAKFAGRRAARAAWRLGRPVVACVARNARPAVRGMLKLPGLRPLGSKLLGRNTRIGRRVRSFLFPRTLPDTTAGAGPVILSAEATAVEDLMRRAIERNKRAQ